MTGLPPGGKSPCPRCPAACTCGWAALDRPLPEIEAEALLLEDAVRFRRLHPGAMTLPEAERFKAFERFRARLRRGARATDNPDPEPTS